MCRVSASHHIQRDVLRDVPLGCRAALFARSSDARRYRGAGSEGAPMGSYRLSSAGGSQRSPGAVVGRRTRSWRSCASCSDRTDRSGQRPSDKRSAADSATLGTNGRWRMIGTGRSVGGASFAEVDSPGRPRRAARRRLGSVAHHACRAARIFALEHPGSFGFREPTTGPKSTLLSGHNIKA